MVYSYQIAIIILFALTGCRAAGFKASPGGPEYNAFGNPLRITIQGYSGQAMEPFITRDGQYLFFNNSNDPSVDTNLHYAGRINDVTFEYKGEIKAIRFSHSCRRAIIGSTFVARRAGT
jgi:hypothetical protein